MRDSGLRGLFPSPPRLTSGRLLYLAVHRPSATVRNWFRDGGPWVQWQSVQGERRMRRAAAALPTVAARTGAPWFAPEVLTGERFWHQTAFCLWSLARHLPEYRLAPVIHDDGSLAAAAQATLRRVFPSARFISHAEASAKVVAHLPENRYPHLRERWLHYPHLRKLVNPHLAATGAKLVIDSDLLFFRHPACLMDWVRRPSSGLHAIDRETAYGYPPEFMETLAGAPIQPRVNVGLTGLRSEELDWDELEGWTAALMTTHGPHYCLEQALVAMLMARRSPVAAPAEDYVTLPELPEALACRAVMHHYVAHSKRWYFQHNWQRVLAP